MTRRFFLVQMTSLPLVGMVGQIASALKPKRRPRVRPSNSAWPSSAQWDELRTKLGDRLILVHSPLDHCRTTKDPAEIEATFKSMKNPYYIGDEPGLTQSTGWVDAWSTRPSIYAVAAESAADVAAAVDFARKHNLRLVVKGGGHSYHGTSNAPDSLLVWTHRMNRITLHDAFIPSGGEGHIAAQSAVTVDAGCLWMHVYHEVSVKHGRYVQGGGCATVGVAGLVQSGGFGSFSKNFGTAAASLLEAEVVTADGVVRTANARTNPDLFWALKGGGGGNWGAVTKLTLKTHELPSTFGAVFATIRAKSDASFKALLTGFLRFYRERLLNPHWGEIVRVHSNNSLESNMVFQGLDKGQAQAVWKEFFDWVKSEPGQFEMADPLIVAVPAQNFWDGEFWARTIPQAVTFDDRPGAPKTNVLWAGNRDECGIYWHSLESVWLPQSLLSEDRVSNLVEALFTASRSWDVEIHFNKGLAGAPAAAREAAKDTATNPAVLDAFALVIIAGGDEPAYAGVPGHEPQLERGRVRAKAIHHAMTELRKVIPDPGSYVSESSYFESNWQHAYWGTNHRRLQAVKKKYDPDGLFFVHNGVGSEEWSEDGFTPMPL